MDSTSAQAPHRATFEQSSELPEGALPEGALPEGALPEGALPEGALPGGGYLVNAPVSKIEVPINRLRAYRDPVDLAASILQIGLLHPITITESGVLVSGRHRLEAVRSLGWENVPAFIVPDDEVLNRIYEIDENLKRLDLTELERDAHYAEREKLMRANGERRTDGRHPNSANLAELKTTPEIAAEHGEAERTYRRRKSIGERIPEDLRDEILDAYYQPDSQCKLADNQSQLNYLAGVDDPDDQREIVGRVLGGEARDVFEASKTLKKERRKKEREDTEQRLQDEAGSSLAERFTVTSNQDVIRCDALITDPPYGILKEGWEPSDLERFTREWARRWNECGADVVCIFWSQRYLWEGRRWFDESLEGYGFKQLLIWHYPNNKSPQDRLGFKQTWEPIFFYRRNGADRRLEPPGGEWGDGLNDFDCHVAAVPQSNFNGQDAKSHPAQKPVSVMRWLTGTLTTPGELIADPFAGSGTTGVAALQLGRRFHGIEISPEYRELSRRRVAAYAGL